MSIYYGKVHNGTVVLPADSPFREGQRVRVEPVQEEPADDLACDQVPALDENHPACGMWADRTDIEDSVVFSRMLRERLVRRCPDGGPAS